MIKCPFCQIEYIENTVFCNECGAYLLEEDKRETDPLDTKKIGWVGNGAALPDINSEFKVDFHSAAIRFRIGPKKREVEIPLEKTIQIGRVDPTVDIFPEIDLTHDGRIAKSVSRRHAVISLQDDFVYIEDVGSFNGTYINGKRLDPYLPEPLHDGDTIQIGKLLMDVSIRRR